MASGLLDCRSRFPALSRTWNGKPAIFFDGPAGSQVPQSVIDAISDYLLHHNANHGGTFITSKENDAIVYETQCALADLLGTADPELIAFGANMTTLTFAISRAIATRWRAGDEILVTRLDHDANVSPWVRAAQDRGVTVQNVGIHPEDCTLDLEDFKRKLSSKTKLVAFGCVSNAVGTRNPIEELTAMAHEAGALVFLDAVHHAPHLSIDVTQWNCDFLVCSAYKFFGPHVGILYGKREFLEDLPAYKVRPAPETLPDRWMTGTQNFECIAGVGATVRYLESLGQGTNRRERLLSSFQRIEEYETRLSKQLIEGLSNISGIQIRGITDLNRLDERVSTFSFTHSKVQPKAIAEYLGERGIFVWHGNYYALPLTETLGLEPHGMVRVGALHYNTSEEIDRLVTTLRELPV